MMTEQEFKDIRLTLDYNESQAGKIQKKIDSQLSKKGEFQTELAEIDHHVSILDCALDRHALLREVGNWQNRRQRGIERVMRILKDRDGLTQLRESLNTRWVELTGDSQPLCEDLTLKNDLKFYAI